MFAGAVVISCVLITRVLTAWQKYAIMQFNQLFYAASYIIILHDNLQKIFLFRSILDMAKLIKRLDYERI